MSDRDNPIELNEFVNSTMDAIEKGADLKHRSISGPVEFELTVKETRKLEGGAKIYVVAGSARSEKENTATIKFNVNSKHRPNGRIVNAKQSRTKFNV